MIRALILSLALWPGTSQAEQTPHEICLYEADTHAAMMRLRQQGLYYTDVQEDLIEQGLEPDEYNALTKAMRAVWDTPVRDGTEVVEAVVQRARVLAYEKCMADM